MRNYGSSQRFIRTSVPSFASNSNVGLTGSPNFSLHILYQFVTPAINSAGAIIALGTFGSRTIAAIYVPDNTRQMSFSCVDSAINGPIIVPNKWYDIIITHASDKSVKIYIDGELYASGAFTNALLLLDAPFKISDASAGYVNGYVSDACLWNRVLSADEAYNFARKGICPTTGLLRRYLFDEGTGTVAYGLAPLADPLVNGNFEGAAGPPPAGWTQTTSVCTREAGTRTGGSGFFVGQVAYNGATASGGLTQGAALVIGNTYHVTGWARGDGIGGVPVIRDNAYRWTGTTSTTWQYFDVTFVATAIWFGAYGTSLAAGRYVQFDDISITPYDNGTITNGSWTSNTINKQYPVLTGASSSITCVGTTSYISSNSNCGITGAAAFSMSCWCKNFNAKAAAAYLLHLGTAGGAGRSISGTFDSSGKFTIILESTGSFSSYTNIIQINKWQHYTITCTTAGLVKIYVDGALVGQGSPGLFQLVNGKFYFGNTPYGTASTNGNVCDACLWTRELTADEVYKLAKYSIVPSTNLIRRYKCQEGSGTTVVDSSVTNDPGTITNGTWSSDAPLKKRTF